MAREIALDLEEKNHLEQEVQLLNLEKKIMNSIGSGREKQDRDGRLKLELLKIHYLPEIQLRVEKGFTKKRKIE